MDFEQPKLLYTRVDYGFCQDPGGPYLCSVYEAYSPSAGESAGVKVRYSRELAGRMPPDMLEAFVLDQVAIRLKLLWDGRVERLKQTPPPP